MIELERQLLDAQITLCLATGNLDRVVEATSGLSDSDAMDLIDPYADAVVEANRVVVAITDRINLMTPSAYQRNEGR